MTELRNLKLDDKVVQPSDIEDIKTMVSAANANLAAALDGTEVA